MACPSGQSEAGALAARVARVSYGRLLALAAARSGDIAGAEDALSEAFRQALETWPRSGLPANPEGWLLTAARRRQLDARRSAAVRLRADMALDDIAKTENPDLRADAIPDERLKLLLVCAHPAIDPAIRSPLMLQTVLGLEAEAIGKAFLVPPAAMAQRLVRAKRKIMEAGIPFSLPERSDIAERLESVLEAIYGAFSIGWERPDADGGLEEEALFLAQLLAQLAPQEAEAHGLAALAGFTAARRPARHAGENGAYVPLEQQDTALWNHRLIGQAEAQLLLARRLGPIGRFQLEAAIQSVHADRARTGATDWSALALLYEGLTRLAPSIGSAVGRAVAIAQVQGPEAGLAALDVIDADVRKNFQPAWAARGHLLMQLRRGGEAVAAFDRAIELAKDPGAREFLRKARQEAESWPPPIPTARR